MTNSKFTSEFFAGNRARLKDLFTGTAPIVLTANGLLQRGGDSAYTFAQDASFWYLTGLDEPDITLVMDRDKEYLIVPGRSASREAFDGKVKTDELSRRSGIITVYDDMDGWKTLGGRLKKVKHVATLAVSPAYVGHYGLYTNPARGVLVDRLKDINPALKLLDLGPHLTRMRMIKQAPELYAIKAAIDITIAAFKEAARPARLSKYAYEYELEAAITGGMRKRGASGHAFPPIVAGGQRATTLHNTVNNAALSADELIVVDIGAEVEHYAGDITRTIGLKTVSRRHRAVHEAVQEIQQQAFGLLKPGILLKDYEQQIVQLMGEKLRELGLMKSITPKAVRYYYPHATSHFLGLNVHDVGDYDHPLEPGIVMTVEPGIYIPEEGIGVRIEDDVLITGSGIKILSNKLPRGLS
ncbi:MAG TPA: Xaa-Pro aminopeptidase [Candidatus Dormibacteraeota bacterium]|nr:Xaa-Pro aminopeptidase [Candidatus Dormibacteraeota bacterium]